MDAIIDLPDLPAPAVVEQTRGAWHALAEHVLAAACHDTARRIGLVVVPGGFGTPPFERDGETEEVHVVGSELIVRRGAVSSSAPISTLRDAAARVGIPPGAPTTVFRPTTPLDPDRELAIDDRAAAALAAWFALGWSVLARLRDTADAGDLPSAVQLWPEHFDAAIELGDASTFRRGTFGVSPGDAEHPAPYLYVTHWCELPEDPYWNDTVFNGASRSYDDVRGAPDLAAAALAFFADGRARLRDL
jgi:hypothetical protein